MHMPWKDSCCELCNNFGDHFFIILNQATSFLACVGTEVTAIWHPYIAKMFVFSIEQQKKKLHLNFTKIPMVSLTEYFII